MSQPDITAADEKLERQQAIVELLRSQDLRTQEEVAREVTRRGFKVTQATISRDLTELQVVKISGHYRVNDLAGVTPLERAIVEHGRSVDLAGDHLVVLKTEVGSANAVAIELDKAEWGEVVGTVAGDDTIFVAVRGKKDRDVAVRKLHRLLERGGHG